MPSQKPEGPCLQKKISLTVSRGPTVQGASSPLTNHKVSFATRRVSGTGPHIARGTLLPGRSSPGDCADRRQRDAHPADVSCQQPVVSPEGAATRRPRPDSRHTSKMTHQALEKTPYSRRLPKETSERRKRMNHSCQRPWHPRTVPVGDQGAKKKKIRQSVANKKTNVQPRWWEGSDRHEVPKPRRSRNTQDGKGWTHLCHLANTNGKIRGLRHQNEPENVLQRTQTGPYLQVTKHFNLMRKPRNSEWIKPDPSRQVSSRVCVCAPQVASWCSCAFLL